MSHEDPQWVDPYSSCTVTKRSRGDVEPQEECLS